MKKFLTSKSFILVTLVAIVSSILFTDCKRKSPQPVDAVIQSDVKTSNTEQVMPEHIGQNFNLYALSDIIVKDQNPATVERKINNRGSINNLDLDKNGKTDFVRIVQEGVVLKFVIDLADGMTTLAKVTLNKGGLMVVEGNPEFYGSDSYFERNFDAANFHMFRPGYTPYVSPYYYGYYPTYYSPYPVLLYSAYLSSPTIVSTRTTVSSNSGTYVKKTRPKNSNSNFKSTSKTASKTASTVSTNYQKKEKLNTARNGNTLSNAKGTQKEFKARDTKKTSEVKGFGANKNKGSTPATTKTDNKKDTKTAFGSSNSNSKKSSSSSSSSSKKTNSSYSKPSKSYSSPSRSYSSPSRSSSGRSRCDINSKENISDLTYGLDEIMKLTPKTFTYTQPFQRRGYPSGTQIGLIAQEVQCLMPETIASDRHGLLLNYHHIITVMVAAMQEQQQQIKDLEAQVKKLQQ